MGQMIKRHKKIMIVFAVAGSLAAVLAFIFLLLNRSVERSGYYIIDSNGNVINNLMTNYGYSTFNENGLAVARDFAGENEGMSGVIDTDGNIVGGKLFSVDDIRIGNSLSFPIIVREEGKIIILDENFNKIGQIKETYESEEINWIRSEFSEGLNLVSVKKDGKELWGYINTAGDWVIEPQYAMAYPFTDAGIAKVEECDTGLWGIIRKDGSFITEDRFYDISHFTGDCAMVQKEQDGPAAFINSNGEYITDYKYEYDIHNKGFLEGLAVVRQYGEENCVYINKEGEVVIDPKTSMADNFSNGLAHVDFNKFIDKTGKVVIEGDFCDAEPFSKDGYSVVKVEGEFDDEKKDFDYKYGIINTKGEWVFEPQFVFKTFKDEEVQPPKYENGYCAVYLETGQRVKKPKRK